ncbi:MAG: glucosamine-6-phosphate deaminase [Oceanipulchritudo sp.]
MTQSALLKSFPFGEHTGRIYDSPEPMGEAAAEEAAGIIREALESQPVARIMIGTGNSQESSIQALVHRSDLDWSRIEVFHMDEYIGISPDHPASFRRWLKTRVADVAKPAVMHYMMGDADDIDAEIQRYSDLLEEAPLDLSFLGFGENGHIAFNDPHVADFNDPATVKSVDLDEACRRQQVGEGHFPDLQSVPTHALTVTCPGLLRARALVCVVPEKRKAKAVRDALKGPVDTVCPGSIVRTHPGARLFLDRDSASLLEE